MKSVSIIGAFALALFLLGGITSPSVAEESTWASPDDPTVKFIIETEGKWAASECSPHPDIKDVFADEFQGTTTTGERYGKEDALTNDEKSPSRDCQLGEVKVRFFGDSIA